MFFEWCIWSEEHQEKRNDYIIGTVYVAYYGLSVVMANVASGIAGGMDSIRICWDIKGILCMVPAAAILSFVEVTSVRLVNVIHCYCV